MENKLTFKDKFLKRLNAYFKSVVISPLNSMKIPVILSVCFQLMTLQYHSQALKLIQGAPLSGLIMFLFLLGGTVCIFNCTRILKKNNTLLQIILTIIVYLFVMSMGIIFVSMFFDQLELFNGRLDAFNAAYENATNAAAQSTALTQISATKDTIAKINKSLYISLFSLTIYLFAVVQCVRGIFTRK